MLLFYHLQSILYNSTKTKDFTRLYLDVTTITGSYCHLAGNGEDDISLSSVDEDDNDSVSEDYTEENKKNHQNDISVIAQQSADVDHGEEVVVDLTSSPSSGRQQQQKSSSSSRISHRGDSHDDLKTEHQRLKRIAKKFKRQFLQKNVQYKEQYDEKKKISEKFRQTEKEMSEMKDGVDKMKRDQQMTNLHFNESRLSLLRTLTELDLLKSQKSTLEKEKSKLDSQMKNCHSYYENELEKARTKSMSEGMWVMYIHLYIHIYYCIMNFSCKICIATSFSLYFGFHQIMFITFHYSSTNTGGSSESSRRKSEIEAAVTKASLTSEITYWRCKQ